MQTYHKIQSMFKRDERGQIVEGDWSLPEFEYLANNQWLFTEKVDGTNIRVMWDSETKKVTFGGKSDNAQIPAKLVDHLRSAFVDNSGFTDLPTMCLYGEGYGAGIQKGGGNYSKVQKFVLFDVWVGGWWLRPTDVMDIAERLGVEVVPAIGSGTLQDAIDLVRAGQKSQWGDFTAEGIVARPAIPLFSRNGDRIITKIKHRDFA